MSKIGFYRRLSVIREELFPKGGVERRLLDECNEDERSLYWEWRRRSDLWAARIAAAHGADALYRAYLGEGSVEIRRLTADQPLLKPLSLRNKLFPPQRVVWPAVVDENALVEAWRRMCEQGGANV